MAATYLDSIAASHRARVAADERNWRERRERIRYHGPSLATTLARDADGRVKVIAEVKRRSPSKGWLARDVDAGLLAGEYVAGGASAISVLTDQQYFAGSFDDLATVRNAVAVPLLRKDFTLSENDVLDTAEHGASGVLLIAALLSDEELAALSTLALEVGLTPLVEVHAHDEARRALDLGVTVIGVNQRDLHTFEVNPRHAADISAGLPDHALRVCESGLSTADDVRVAALAGFDAVLVGEVFVTCEHPVERVREFASVSLVDRV